MDTIDIYIRGTQVATQAHADAMEAALRSYVDTQDNALEAALETQGTELQGEINTLRDYVDAQDEALTQDINALSDDLSALSDTVDANYNELSQAIEDVTLQGSDNVTITNKVLDVSILNTDAETYSSMSQTDKDRYLLAFVEPMAELTPEDLSTLENILNDAEPTQTVIDMTDEEVNDALDNIIGGE